MKKNAQTRKKLNVDRFKAHFGPELRTVKDVLNALKEEFGSSMVFKDVMMLMSWIKHHQQIQNTSTIRTMGPG